MSHVVWVTTPLHGISRRMSDKSRRTTCRPFAARLGAFPSRSGLTARRRMFGWFAAACAVWSLAATTASAADLSETIRQVQRCMVKVYGAGGLSGLEAYQSGFLVSSDGYIVTAWSYVLDTDFVVAVLHDGSRHQATVAGIDPRLEIALLKIDAQGLPFLELDPSVELLPGQRVLAFSNLYGIAAGNEPVSVLHGVVSAVTELSARRGVFRSPYQGSVYVLDAVTNNAGAAGGALTDWQGRLAGVLGKELRNAEDNTWLNYAVPVAVIQPAVEALREGRRLEVDPQRRPAQQPLTLHWLGITLVPQVLANTPAYVDQVAGQSPAGRAGLRPDDLIVMVNQRTVQNSRQLVEELQWIETGDPFRLVVLRNQQIVDIEIVDQP